MVAAISAGAFRAVRVPTLTKGIPGRSPELDCQGTAELVPSIMSTRWSGTMTVVLNFHGLYSRSHEYQWNAGGSCGGIGSLAMSQP
jgi:hypothetical protein